MAGFAAWAGCASPPALSHGAIDGAAGDVSADAAATDGGARADGTVTKEDASATSDDGGEDASDGAPPDGVAFDLGAEFSFARNRLDGRLDGQLTGVLTGN